MNVVAVPKKALLKVLLLMLATAALVQKENNNLLVVMMVSGFQLPVPLRSASSSSTSLLPLHGSVGWTRSKNYVAVVGCHPIISSRSCGAASFPSSSSSTTTTTTTCTTRLSLANNNNNLDDDDDDDDDFFPSQQGRNNDNNYVNTGSSSSHQSLSRRIKNSGGGGVGGGSGGGVVKSFSVTMALCTVLLVTSPVLGGNSHAAVDNTADYASETVQTTIKALKDAADPAATFKAYETLADIITEGSGLGGSVNFQGVTVRCAFTFFVRVCKNNLYSLLTLCNYIYTYILCVFAFCVLLQLERGYISDEDTAIYNPGLTLLTESEKERLVKAVIASRSTAVQAGTWSGENQLAFEFLREKLDPYHMQELSGFLGILPFYSAVIYLAVLGVQQLARDFFPAAYFAGVAAVFLPAIALVLLGPS